MSLLLALLQAGITVVEIDGLDYRLYTDPVSIAKIKALDSVNLELTTDFTVVSFVIPLDSVSLYINTNNLAVNKTFTALNADLYVYLEDDVSSNKAIGVSDNNLYLESTSTSLLANIPLDAKNLLIQKELISVNKVLATQNAELIIQHDALILNKVITSTGSNLEIDTLFFSLSKILGINACDLLMDVSSLQVAIYKVFGADSIPLNLEILKDIYFNADGANACISPYHQQLVNLIYEKFGLAGKLEVTSNSTVNNSFKQTIGGVSTVTVTMTEQVMRPNMTTAEVEQMIHQIAAVLGLVAGSNLVVTKDTRDFDGLHQKMEHDGSKTTVEID